MKKTKEMFDATHRRNSQNDWNIEDEETSTIGNWLEHDLEGANHALGEDLVSAVSQALDYD